MTGSSLSLPARILGRMGSLAAVRTLVRPFRRGRVTVFLLHRAEGVHDGIRGHRPAELQSVLTEFRRAGIVVMSLEEVVAAAQGGLDIRGDAVAFTMDDGYHDQIELLAPIFIEQGCPLTLFVITGLVDGRLWPWDAKVSWLVRQARGDQLRIPWGRVCLEFPLGIHDARRSLIRQLQAIFAGLAADTLEERLAALEASVGRALPDVVPPEYRPASWADLRRIEERGISIAPHTVSHRIISRLSAPAALWEITESVSRVRTEMRRGLPYLAWPVGKSGHFGPRDLALAHDAGVLAAFAASGNYADLRACTTESLAIFQLDRYAVPKPATHAFRYATGLEAARQAIASVAARVRPAPSAIATPKAGATLRRPIKIARQLIVGSLSTVQVSVGRYSNLRRIDPSRIERLVFVCKGNVCRSPYAAARASEFHIVRSESCGLDVQVQAPAEPNAVKVGLARGLDLSAHVSKSIRQVQVRREDCLVVMEPEQARMCQLLAREVGCQVTLLGLWRRKPVVRIPDPHGRSLVEFDRTFALIDDALRGLEHGLRR